MGKANAVVGQSGGPTSVINCSLAGVMETAAVSSAVDRLYGMRFAMLFQVSYIQPQAPRAGLPSVDLTARYDSDAA